jgi:anion-transporting  ArsA/GET3 family ATPase
LEESVAVPELIDKRLVFVTGKGGVGKSTISIALGLAAAARGKRTIVCEIGGQETQVADNLWAISIDPDQSLREYLLLQLRVRAMRDMLVRSRLFNYLAAATPGLKELVTIGKIWELAQPNRKVKKAREYDLVIVDAPATGHGVGFLQTPRTFAGIARVGPVHSQAQELDRFITDHDTTGVAIVSLPEEMPVNESASLEDQLTNQIGISVDRVYMNALYPERFSKGDASELERALEEAEGPARAAVRAALSEQRRARSQRAQLQRLKRAVSVPVKTLPFVFKPTLDVPSLERLAGAL